jgi:hypothetical protein
VHIDRYKSRDLVLRSRIPADVTGLALSGDLFPDDMKANGFYRLPVSLPDEREEVLHA